MKHQKLLSMILALVMAAALMAACAAGDGAPAGADSNESAGDEQVTLTYFNTSAEVNTMFEEMFARYHEINPNVTIELIPTGIGEGQQEKLQSLYASGNGPSMMNIDPANVIEYANRLVELTPENAPWMSFANDGVIEAGTFDGKTLGVPFSVQGYGLLYNKRVVDEVYGGEFDPDTINTRDALGALLDKVEETGVAGTMLHGANWSLGGHYLTLSYAVQGSATSDGTGFIDKIVAGEAKIEDSPIFQGYMDTMDMLVEHNYNKADPLVADLNADTQAFGEGKSATFFMGDWNWTIMGTLENVDQEYGFIPVPWSNNPEDYGNTQVVMVLPKLFCVDASNNTPEQQQAAVDFCGWALTDPEGQQFFIDAGFCMPFNNIPEETTYNSQTQAVSGYASESRTINLGVFSYISGDAWTQTGNLMLQYVDGVIDRQELADGINAYWQSAR
ncbi:MAG: ABC transporter substrate-binding protein [Clostridiales bacterium]|jgi:raffinose/stachyose/melibiose transport system substrate-binding protein|nr:ABC transporter substrate-binding protein [Clostridiales bacterium]